MQSKATPVKRHLSAPARPPQKRDVASVYPRMITEREFEEVVRLGVPPDAERKTLWLNLCGPNSKNAGKLYLSWGDQFVFFWDTKFAVHKKVALGKLSGLVNVTSKDEDWKNGQEDYSSPVYTDVSATKPIPSLERQDTEKIIVEEEGMPFLADDILEEIIQDIDLQEDKKRKAEGEMEHRDLKKSRKK